MNKFLFGVLVSWNCWAQTAGRTPQPIDVDSTAGLRRDLVPDPDVPFEMSPRKPQERPTGQSISISQLQHKIPKEADRSYKHAKKLSRAGQHGKAAAELEKLVQRDPEFPQAQNLLGVEYAQLGLFGKAEAALRRSLELEPGSWSAHYNLGLVLYRKGDASGAEQSARRALQYSSQNPQVHLLLGYLLVLREETRAEGLKEMEFAARTMTAARSFLRDLDAR